MFPDPTLKWAPYPSEIDGIGLPAFVTDQGIWRGKLHLVVDAMAGPKRLYGIEIGCQIYAGYDEMIYSVAGHAAATAFYPRHVYIREAERSALLAAYAGVDPMGRKPRHFGFTGNDYCYEVLSFSQPIIQAVADLDEANAWVARRRSSYEA